MNKTKHALCGLISGLLVLAAGTPQTHAALLVPAAPGDSLYVASQVPTHTIVKLTPGGVGSFFANTGGDATGVAFDSAGNLYVTNARDNILRFTPAGVGSIFADGGDGLKSPGALAFDGAGNLYVGNSANNTIVKVTPGGIGSLFASTAPNHQNLVWPLTARAISTSETTETRRL